MSKEERKRHIVARANFYTQASQFDLRVLAAVERRIQEAYDAGNYSITRPPQALNVDREYVFYL